MVDKYIQTNVQSEVHSISNLPELEIFFEKIKQTEPQRYAHLEEIGELDRQRALITPKILPKAEEKKEPKSKK